MPDSLLGETAAPATTPSAANTILASPNNTPTSSTNASQTSSLVVSSSSPPSKSSSIILIDPTTNASSSLSPAVTSTPQTAQLTTSKHLSAGGIAGVAIGCAVLGAILAFLVMMFLRRSQTKSSSRHRKAHSHLTHKSPRSDKDPDKSLARPSVAAVVQPSINVDAFLPQQADDATAKQKFLLLFDQIELHVDNYYSDQPLQLTSEQQGELSRFGTPELPMPLGALLETSHRKVAVIKHCLAFHAVQLVSPSHASDCLLPSEISNMLALSTPRPGDRNFYLALSRWRMLTAYLRPDLFDRKEPGSTEQDVHLYNLAKTFSDRFAAFSQPQNADQKIKHLAEVLRTAVRVALWLYSQPATFKFDWGPASDAPRRSTPTVITIPSLLKTHDGMGAEIQPPQIIHLLVKRRV